MHDTKRKQYEQLARKYHIKLVFIIAERKEHGHPVNGYQRERVIYLNYKLGEHTDQILGHELTHLVRAEGKEYRKIQRILFEVARRRNEYNSRLESITELYKDIDTDLEEELTADLTGDYIFGEEFVNELVQDKTAFQKVHDHIKEWIKVVTSGSPEYKQIYEAKKLFTKALKKGNQQEKNETRYALSYLPSGQKYVYLDHISITNEDDSIKTDRQFYEELSGTELVINDGDIIQFAKYLVNKDMCNEVFRRYPRYKRVNNIKELNSLINRNIIDITINSVFVQNKADVGQRHSKIGVSSFDTRSVSIYEGKKAFDLVLSIAVLNNGKKIIYAKKAIFENKLLTKQIKMR